MIEMNTQILEHKGKATHVVMTIDEFKAWNEQIEDEMDVKLIREAQARNVGKPRFTMEEARAKLGLK